MTWLQYGMGSFAVAAVVSIMAGKDSSAIVFAIVALSFAVMSAAETYERNSE